jgi:hypothetical protein
VRQHVPRRVRMLLSPLRRRGSRAVRRALHRAARHTGRVGDYRYVFVLTYGRSGSTVLAGLLNAIPGYRVRGENYNVLYRLYQADAAIARACERFSGAEHLEPRSAWYGTPLVRPHRFRAALVDAFVTEVLRPRRGDRVLGFKEIRCTPAHIPDLDDYLAFLRDAFPNCKIIFNHRDPAAVARSGWWTGVSDAEARIRAADERLRAYPEDGSHFHFVHDEIDDSLANVRALMRFLGEDIDEPALRAVLARRFSPYPATDPGGSSSAITDTSPAMPA